MSSRRNLLVGQSGGPTSVINGSLAGVIEQASGSDEIGRILGMNFAIEGVLKGEFVDLGKLSKKEREYLRDTPSSALGSSRLKLKEEHFPKILEVLKTFDIRFFHLIGGNDSMDTINRVVKYAAEQGHEMAGVGVPKTVDNDLFGTDHTPGFPSAARYTALSVMQSGKLAADMRNVDQYVIYQSIGRDAGWLPASSVMGKRSEEEAPHILVIPERPLNREKFLKKVEEVYQKYGWVSVACGEGVTWEDGTPVSASETKDKFGNIEFGAMGGSSVALNLHRIIHETFPAWRGEFQITESLPMCGADRMSAVDREEAFLLGKEAVKQALSGNSGNMVGLKRTADSPYATEMSLCPLSDVAEKTKPIPDDFIDDEGFMVTEKFRQYMEPLTGDMPEYLNIKKDFVQS